MMSRTRSCLVSMVQMCTCKSLYKIDQTKEEHIESKQMSLSCSYLLLTSKVSLYKLRAVHAGSFVYFLSVLYVGSFGCYWLPKYLCQLAKSFTILIPDRVRGKNQRNPDRSRHGGPVQQVLKDKICSRSRVS